MKNLFTKTTSIFFVFAILAMSLSTAFAAEGELIINEEATVKVGDKIKFNLYLSDTVEEIIGFEMRLFFDNEYLEYIPDSLEFEKFDNVYYNSNLEGKIPMSWTNINDPISFSTKASFLSAEFKVLKDGKAEISHFVTEMYGDDMTYLKSYKWTYAITVNDEKILDEGVLPISRDEETLKNRQSSFINYIDGMGEENTPNKDNHEAVVGDNESATYNVYDSDVVSNTRYVDVTKDGKVFSPVIIVVFAILLLGALIVVAIILVSKGNKNSK